MLLCYNSSYAGTLYIVPAYVLWQGVIELDLEALINKHYNELNENDLQILAFVRKNRETFQKMTVISLAEQTHTSKSTIVRLAKKLGFSGFSEFKYSLRKTPEESAAETPAILFGEMQLDDVKATAKLIGQVDLTPILEKIVSADRIFCYGTGWGQRDVLSDFRRNLITLEKFPILLSAKKELEIAVKTTISENDLLIVLSLSGDIKEVTDEMHVLNLNGTPILSITSLRNNSLASLASYNLYFQCSPVLLNGTEVFSFLPLFQVMDILFRKLFDFYTIQSTLKNDGI